MMNVPLLWLEYATESSSAADILFEDGFAVDAVSRSYYAMLYASQALLTREHIFLRHSTEVIAAIGKEFVLSEQFPEKQHRYLVEIYNLRMRSDHDVFFLVEESEARKQTKRAHEYVQCVAKIFESDKKK
jgi:uncharacterized protein